jgi:aryl-alcohol dehydrogenase-like predicted oxidoreductase
LFLKIRLTRRRPAECPVYPEQISLFDAGTIRYAGLSEVSIDDIVAASKIFKVSTVQNRFNLSDRESESVLDYCDAQSIGFIPGLPLASGNLAESTFTLHKIAEHTAHYLAR